MVSVNFYQSQDQLLYKSACKLIEKCYHAGEKTLVLTVNQEQMKSIDDCLWSYAHNFIPHATCEDPLPEEHPVLIAHSADSLTAQSLVMLFSPNRASIMQIMPNLKTHNPLSKLMIINAASEDIQDLAQLVKTSGINDLQMHYFLQNAQGVWLEKK
jgi:DNA polymerase IIIc chi subunit